MPLNRDERVRLEAAVATTDSPVREIFPMHRLERLGYPEVGARLGLSVAEVEQGLAAAMVHLTRVMDEAEARESGEGG